MNKIYTDINECVNDVINLAVNYAIDGVNKKIGGPFGAGIIQQINDNEYKILIIDRNNVIFSKDVTGHAEINAIRKACKVLNKIELDDCILVTTAKSCPMCLSAACWAKIKTIYYGVDYSCANASGFKDSAILNYLNNNDTTLIKEINLNNLSCKAPFNAWEKLEDKTMY